MTEESLAEQIRSLVAKKFHSLSHLQIFVPQN